MFSRVLISQDGYQIFLTIAEYTQQYIDYLHNPDKVNINDDFTLTMRMFGDYDTTKPGDMELLGVLVKVILTHAAQSVRTSSSRSLFSEPGEPSSVMENVTRSVESMNIQP